jgi:hypothetical protein
MLANILKHYREPSDTVELVGVLYSLMTPWVSLPVVLWSGLSVVLLCLMVMQSISLPVIVGGYSVPSVITRRCPGLLIELLTA